MNTPHIFHFTPKELWNAKNPSDYLPKGFDSEGFIHCSFSHQLFRSVNKHADKSKTHVVLKINPKALTSKLVYENTSGGTEDYPHIYGPINREAILEEFDLVFTADGSFNLPPTDE